MKPDRAKLAIRLVTSVLVFCGRLLDNRVVNALAHEYRRSVWSRKLGALGPDAAIYRWVAIHNAKKVRIGRLISIAEFCHVWGGGGVEIGDEVMIASHVTITSQSHFTDPARRRAANDRPVTIGNRVWIGSHAVILPGVTIGDDSVIAAGAVVTKDVPTGSIVAGVPARVIGSCQGETARWNS